MPASRYAVNPSFVLGFHGCDKSRAEKVLAGEGHLPKAENDYDWLGNGIYFWESDEDRAFAWAKSLPHVKEPAVVGAVIDLGFCLNLTQSGHLTVMKAAYEVLEKAFEARKEPMPTNEYPRRKLDCAVVENVHKLRESLKGRPFQSVRSFFPEGEELYKGAGFRASNHIQVCVRDTSLIKGYFRPIGDELTGAVP